MSLNTIIRASIRCEQVTALDQGTARAAVVCDASATLLDGTGTSLADLVWSDTRILTASATETHDLDALTDPLGVAINFAKIKAIIIKAASGNTNSVIVGAAASNQFLGPLGGSAHTLTIPPGGAIMLLAPISGWATANGSTDLLKIANSAGSTSVTYDIIIVGTSA
jgi:hypothetical protein